VVRGIEALKNMSGSSSNDPFADPFGEEDSPEFDFVSVGGSMGSGFELSHIEADDGSHSFGELDDPFAADGLTSEASAPVSDFTSAPLPTAEPEIERPSSVGALPRAAPSGPSLMERAMGVTGQALVGPPQGAKYLPKVKARSLWENAMHTTGLLYLSAGAVGVSVGLVGGVRDAKNYRARILLNSVLNSCGRTGSRLANSAAVIGMMYTGATWALDHAEFDKVPRMMGLRRQEVYTPMAAIGVALLVFRSPLLVGGTPAQRMGALLTPLLGAGAIAAVASAAPLIGANAPFRWH
jgi:hypothetical protein